MSADALIVLTLAALWTVGVVTGLLLAGFRRR